MSKMCVRVLEKRNGEVSVFVNYYKNNRVVRTRTFRNFDFLPLTVTNTILNGHHIGTKYSEDATCNDYESR